MYYLIFTAYILFTVRFEPPDSGSISGLVTAELAQMEVVRVGGILLIIGVLHGLNIVLMPVLGQLFSLNRRLPRGRCHDVFSPTTSARSTAAPRSWSGPPTTTTWRDRRVASWVSRR